MYNQSINYSFVLLLKSVHLIKFNEFFKKAWHKRILLLMPGSFPRVPMVFTSQLKALEACDILYLQCTAFFIQHTPCTSRSYNHMPTPSPPHHLIAPYHRHLSGFPTCDLVIISSLLLSHGKTAGGLWLWRWTNTRHPTMDRWAQWWFIVISWETSHTSHVKPLLQGVWTPQGWSVSFVKSREIKAPLVSIIEWDSLI